MALTSAGADSTRIYDELLVTTAEAIQPGIVENSINAHPVASIFLGNIGAALNSAIGNTGAPEAAGAKSMTGESIRVNVKLGKNESVGWLASGYSQISMDTSDTARGTRANYKLAAGSVVIDGSTLRKNSGAAQVTSILNHKQNDTTSSLVDMVAEAMLTSSSAPNSVTSLATMISANDSIQGLSGATFANWNSRGVSAKGTAAASISFTSGSFAAQGVADMRIAFMNAEEGSIKPNVILTTDTIYRYYEGSLTPQVRFEDLRTGDLSFSALRFKNAPIFHDPFCASGTMFFLNTEYLEMVVHTAANWSQEEEKTSINQDGVVIPLLWMGNLVCSNRSLQGTLIDAA